MVKCQGKNATVASSQGTFDVLLEDPEPSHFSAQDASTVHKPVFESSVAKVQNSMIGDLSSREREAVKLFKIRGQPEPRHIEWGESISYYQQLQERKRWKLHQVVAYQDLRFMGGASASVECLFSSAKYVMKERRNRMTPVMFEAIIFLKTNRACWSSRLVAKAIKSVPNMPVDSEE